MACNYLDEGSDHAEERDAENSQRPVAAMSREELEKELSTLRNAVTSQDVTKMKEVELQRNLLRSVGQAIICTDLVGTVTYWNRAATTMYGWTEVEALGSSVLDILKPAGRWTDETAAEVFGQLVQGLDWTGEYSVWTKCGTYLDILVTDTPIMDSGKLVGIIGVSTDISELKRKEAQILELNAGLEKRVVERTKALNESNDRLKSEVVDHLKAKEALQKTFKQMEESKAKIETQAKFLEKLVEELREARKEAESASRLKSRFLAHMSHEIRTPMNGVIGMTDLILSTDLSDEQRGFVQTIRTSGDALLAVIDQILDFSKIEAGELVVEYIDFSIAQVVEDAVEIFAMKAKDKGIELVCHLDQSVPLLGNSDPTRLRQVLVNLISNATKFTDPGGEVMVRVAARQAGAPERASVGELEISVSDSGIGIPLERQSQLFRPFSQLDASTTRKFGGTGLGLVISKQLVEHLGGRMWVHSEGDGKGSTFSFTIALKEGSTSSSTEWPAADGPAGEGPRQDHVPDAAVGGKRQSDLGNCSAASKRLKLDDSTEGSQAAVREGGGNGSVAAGMEEEEPVHRQGMSEEAVGNGFKAGKAAAVFVGVESESVRRTVSEYIQAMGLLPRHPGQDNRLSGHDWRAAVVDFKSDDSVASAESVVPPFLSKQGIPVVLLCPYGVKIEEAAARQGRLFVLNKPVRHCQLVGVLKECGALLPAPAPAAAAAPSSPPSSERQRDPLPARPKPRPLAETHPLEILLVEDNLVNQRVATCMLRQLGYTPDVANNGLEAIQKLQLKRYDLALMDIQMPLMDGIEATKQIHSRWPPEDRPRIVAMTANVLQSDRQLCLSAGMDSFIPKPIKKSILLSALESTPLRAGKRQEE